VLLVNALGFAKTLRSLQKVRSSVAREAAGALQARIDQQFVSGTDPYGNPWKANAASTIARKGHGRVGVGITETMLATTKVVPASGAGLTLTVGVPYAGYFDRVRRLLPDAGLPATWRADLQEIYSRILGAAFK
jgi:hypothetical protein